MEVITAKLALILLATVSVTLLLCSEDFGGWVSKSTARKIKMVCSTVIIVAALFGLTIIA